MRFSFWNIFAANFSTIKAQEKQYTGFKTRLLAMLFFFINAVCIAAPVYKTGSENYRQAIPVQLLQTPNAAETEEDSRPVNTFINQFSNCTLRKQQGNPLYNRYAERKVFSINDLTLTKPSIVPAYMLPVPGYYAFLFRYKPF